MKDKDFSYSKADNSHYSVPSMYGKRVREQYNMQPNYCNPGEAGKMPKESANKQRGPLGK